MSRVVFNALADNALSEDLSARLKRLRKEQDLTQEALAARVGVDKTTVSKWETGGQGLSGANLGRVAIALGVSMDELAGSSGNIVSRETGPPSEAILETLRAGVVALAAQDPAKLKPLADLLLSDLVRPLWDKPQ